MNESRYTLMVNDMQFTVPNQKISALQIRVLANVRPEIGLIWEQAGSEPDIALNDDDTIDLSQGTVRVFTKPPTVFGGACQHP